MQIPIPVDSASLNAPLDQLQPQTLRDRRLRSTLLTWALVLVVLASMGSRGVHWAQEQGDETKREADSNRAAFGEAIRAAAKLGGFAYSDAEIELMLPDVTGRLRAFERMRAIEVGNEVVPALVFQPLGVDGVESTPASLAIELPDVQRPEDLSELYFADIPTLAALIRSQEISCVELAELFLARLESVDETLACVINLTPERALAQARLLDAELAEGHWRGPLHGIPWGAKDLLAVEGYPTTWGAKPFENQMLEGDAATVRALDDAGAVLVAKLTLGALAWGDVWFGGTTKNPWDPSQGSSGSSAGPASAVAAGALPFAIGSETLGSIVSPSERCGNSSLRPTFGRVSREGAMALSWSMDKLGPICRSAKDAAIVFASIQGRDPADPSSFDAAYTFPAKPKHVVVGFLERSAEQSAWYRQLLEDLEAISGTEGGFEVELVPIELPDYPASDMTMILQVEASVAFDELTRSGEVAQLVRQERSAWPNVFRHAQLIPAVEYLRANRLRTLMQHDWETVMSDIDVIVHPSFAGGILQATNLTGHPTVVMPAGFRENGTPFGVSFTGRLFGDDLLLTVASRWQESTVHHLRHPVQ